MFLSRIKSLFAGVICGAIIFVRVLDANASSIAPEPTSPYNQNAGLTEAQQQECAEIEQSYYKLMQKQKSSEMIKLLEAALQKYPNRVSFLAARADWSEQSGEYKLALADYDKIIAIDSLQPGWYLRRAKSNIKLNQLAAAARDLDICLSSAFASPMLTAQALTERAEVDKRLNRISSARKRLDDAEYLRNRLVSGLTEPDGQLRGQFVPRTKDNSRLIKTIYSIAQMGSGTSVSDLEELLKFKPKTSFVTSGRKNLIGGPTDDWTKITVGVKDDGTLLSLDFFVNPLTADLSAKDIRSILGAETPSEGSSTHGPKESLWYRKEKYDLRFLNFEYSVNALNSVSIIWKSPEEYRDQLKFSKAVEDRKASVGTRSAETLSWLRQISELRSVPTPEELVAILNLSFIKDGDHWRNASAPQEQLSVYSNPDYSAEYQPNGGVNTAAQLIVVSGTLSHRITMEQICKEFGDGTAIDGTTLTPRMTGSDIRSYKFPACSMRVTSYDYAREASGAPINKIEFWWKPLNCLASTLEEKDAEITTDSLVAEAETMILNKEFIKAWDTLIRASNRRPAKRPSDVTVEYRIQAEMLRDAYLNWYKAQNRADDVAFIEHVPLIVFRIAQNEACEPSSKLPTVDEYRKELWTVTCSETSCFIKRKGLAQLDINEGPIFEQCKKLFGTSGEEIEVADIPADIIDTMFYK